MQNYHKLLNKPDFYLSKKINKYIKNCNNDENFNYMLIRKKRYFFKISFEGNVYNRNNKNITTVFTTTVNKTTVNKTTVNKTTVNKTNFNKTTVNKTNFNIYQDKYFIGNFSKFNNFWNLNHNKTNLLKIFIKSDIKKPLKIKILKPFLEISNIDPVFNNGKYKLEYKNLLVDTTRLISCKNFIMNFNGKRLIECMRINKNEIIITWTNPLIDLHIFLIGISILF